MTDGPDYSNLASNLVLLGAGVAVANKMLESNKSRTTRRVKRKKYRRVLKRMKA